MSDSAEKETVKEVSPLISPQESFEHLFHGNKFEDLPKVNPRGVLTYPMRIVEKQLLEVNAGAASYAKRAFAQRIQLQFPDQFSLENIELSLITQLIDGKPPRVNWGGLLKRGEKLGGVAMAILPTYEKSDSIFGEIYVAGILSMDNKVKGLAYFLEGKPPKSPRKRIRQMFELPRLAPSPIAVPI